MTSRGWLPAVSACLGILACLWTAHAQSGNGSKYALLIGCSKYLKTEFRELPYTVQDVEGFKKALLATGFVADHIVTLHDDMKERRYLPEKAKILAELNLLLDGLRPQDTLVLAVSGHGVHFKGDATGYFVPVDGKVGDKGTLIPMEGKGGLFELLKACKAKRKLLIVNACRNDPATDVAFATQKIAIDDEDTDQVPEGIAAIYSCKQGQKSYYDPDRKRAIFFDHVIRAWQGDYHKGGKVTLENFFEQVVIKTKIDANKTLQVAQVPVIKREYQGEWVINESKHLDIDLGGGMKMNLVHIQPGTFTMGSPLGEEGRNGDEGPLHEVEISKPFYLGIHEVTRGQFRAFVDAEGYKTDAEKNGEGGWGYDPETKDVHRREPKYTWQFVGFKQTDEHPVVNVSWNDAMAFCTWLSRKERKTVDLPTEAEWEFACRAGTKARFITGDTDASMEGHGNVADTSMAKIEHWKKIFDDNKFVIFPFDDGYSFTAPVGRFKANSLGVFDMHGNVWEWCKDWCDAEYYKNSPRRDPQGSGDGRFRAMRGGSWGYGPSSCRHASRAGGTPNDRDGNVGFRVVVRYSPSN